jgi:hypothetical protein
MPMEIKVMDDTECTDNIAFERRIFQSRQLITHRVSGYIRDWPTAQYRSVDHKQSYYSDNNLAW